MLSPVTNGTHHLLFRTNAGARAGLGHLRRCTALAAALRQLGVQSAFILDGDEPAFAEIEAAGYPLSRLEAGQDAQQTIELCHKLQARAIVVDSYEVDEEYIRTLAHTGIPIVAIDDLADRDLPVSLVINSAAGAEQLNYQGAASTEYLLGPRYALLRPEFAYAPERNVGQILLRVLITVGGSDPFGLTARLVTWAIEAVSDARIDVVIGPMLDGTQASSLIHKHAGDRVTLHRNPLNMRQLMVAADLAISGGGQTTYELAATGTPTVAIQIAENQSHSLEQLASAGTLVRAGAVQDPDLAERVIAALRLLGNDPGRRKAMGNRGRALVDGHGATRVARAIVEVMGKSGS